MFSLVDYIQVQILAGFGGWVRIRFRFTFLAKSGLYSGSNFG
jgi:hypothetical protein